MLAPCLVHASPGWTEFWAQPRSLWMRRHNSGEELKITYWRDGTLLSEPYLEVCKFLRDVHTGEAVQMDPAMLDLLFVVHGYQVSTKGSFACLQVTNAYESKATNRRLVVTHGASRTSKHMTGQAVDIANPVSRIDYVEYMRTLGGGGVGYYPDSGHMHLDTGPRRAWLKRRL